MVQIDLLDGPATPLEEFADLIRNPNLLALRLRRS